MNIIFQLQLSLTLFAGLVTLGLRAAPVLPAWTPIFKGVDYLTATVNTPADPNFPTLQVGYALRIDLSDPDVKLLTTPKIANYQAGVRETGAMTVGRFLQTHQLQAAINANFYAPIVDGGQTEGYPLTADGLLISQGVVVSPQNSSVNSAAIIFDKTNRPTVIHTNWPATSNTGTYTAVSGDYSLVVKGVNISRKYLNLGGIHDLNPRTSFGISQDRRYLILLAIDGRQPGYSNGSYDFETAGWMLLLGAYDAVNMDGGGSTTMVVANSAGTPMELNQSSYVAGTGKERLIGGHLGIYAKPVPSFVTNLVALPDDDAATVTWSTPSPATTQLEYGLAEPPDQATTIQTALTTNHAVLLTNLIPGTGYFYHAVATLNGTRYVSPDYYFTTSNYVTTNAVLSLTSSWKYTSANVSGVNWTAPAYVDTAWSGPGPGLLWADTRNPANPNNVQPENTQMPGNPATSRPYITYYFRTHLSLPNKPTGAALQFTGFIDDGAVIYLNGHEIYRLRMPDAPAVIGNATLAATFPCAGDATCLDEFDVTGPAAGYLNAGDNVIAVEVHNYNAGSSDITFGLSLGITTPNPVNPVLGIAGQPDGPILSWSRGGFVLQEASSPAGPWTDLPGPVFSSPFTPVVSSQSRFYRLHK